MLVLSRKGNDTIRFPELDITIKIVQIKGSVVRVGVDAPVEINILRGELEADSTAKVAKKILVSADSLHDVRNKINGLTLAADLAKKLIAKGDSKLAANRLNEALENIAADSDSIKLVKPIENDIESETTLAGQRPLRALLVEDSANEREMLAGFLRLHGYEVQTVSDGLEAIEYLESNLKPDLILMDMNLPRLDGASTIRQIRDNPAFDGVEIFAVSGQSSETAGIDTQANRIAKWFRKPLQPTGLVNAIEQQIFRASSVPTKV